MEISPLLPECQIAGLNITCYHGKERWLETKQQIVEMALNGSEMYDAARGLSIGTDTIRNELKKVICAQAG